MQKTEKNNENFFQISTLKSLQFEDDHGNLENFVKISKLKTKILEIFKILFFFVENPKISLEHFVNFLKISKSLENFKISRKFC